MQKCNKCCRKDKLSVEVTQSNVVKEYNAFMGDVDKVDMLLELYRIDIRSTKWYRRIIYWCLAVAIVSGWLLCRRHQMQLGRKEDYTLVQFFKLQYQMHYVNMV